MRFGRNFKNLIGFLATIAIVGGTSAWAASAEEEAQFFKASALEALENHFIRWAESNRPDLNPALLKRVIEVSSVEMSSEPLFLDDARQLPRNALNFPARKKIIVYQPAWERMQQNPVKRYSFTLHEFLGIARFFEGTRTEYPEYDDSEYGITSPFEMSLSEKMDVEKFRRELAQELESLSFALKQKFKLESKAMLNNFNLIRSTRDYRGCTHPNKWAFWLTKDERKLEYFGSCFGVVAMVQIVSRQVLTREGYEASSGAGSRSSYLEQQLGFDDTLALLELAYKFGALDVSPPRYAKFKHKLKNLTQQFEPIPVETLPTGTIQNAVDHYLRFAEGRATKTRRDFAHGAGRALMDEFTAAIARSPIATAEQVERHMDTTCKGDLNIAIPCAISQLFKMYENDGPEEDRKLSVAMEDKLNELMLEVSGYREEGLASR
ncbi:MAG: hypothetical protein A2X94_03165 [Bdellovibrionales bacterium GWB1_55_8]|nr:MAG: hypothetical protein A2X94_03165 [Bdellovibrionales bacterium GWB1_55_8]